jgi:hypothetical protein
MKVRTIRQELLAKYKVTNLIVDILIQKHRLIINQAEDAQAAISQIVALENIGLKGTEDGTDANP